MTKPDKPTVLITGAAKRLGQAAAVRFAQDGWHVIVHYNTSAKDAEIVCRQIENAGGRASSIHFDLNEPDQVIAAATSIAEDFPRWQLLINNAAVFDYDKPSDVDPEIFQTAMCVNCLSPMLLASGFVNHTSVDNNRCIINILDQKLDNMNPDHYSYTVSKAGLLYASQMMAMSFAANNVRVSNVAPGITLPSGDQTKEEFETSSKMNPLNRTTNTDDVVDALVYLANAKGVTGQTVFVDSGQHLTGQGRDVMFLVRGET